MAMIVCWCNQCYRGFKVEAGAGRNADTLVCPLCNGGFVQEIGHEAGDDCSRGVELPPHLMIEPRFPYHLPSSSFGTPRPSSFVTMNVALRPSSLVRESLFSMSERRFRRAPLAQLAETMNDGPSPSSSSDTMVLVRGSQNAISLDGLRRRSHSYEHMEDYGTGLLSQYRHGTVVSYSWNDMIRCRTPTAHSAVDAMPTVKITQKHLSIELQCAVCHELFEFGGEAREMPCMHMYHANCILPWLAQNNSCPVCRHKFPVEEECGRRNSESSSTSSSEAHGDLIFGLPGRGFAIGSSPHGSTNLNDASTSRNPSVVIRGGGFVSDLRIRAENQGQRKRTSPPSFLWPFRSSNSNSESSSSSSDPSSSSSNSGNIASSGGGSSRW